MEANEAMKAMARRVAAQYAPDPGFVLIGNADNTALVAAALAAIMETQEACAKLAEDRGPWGDAATHCGDYVAARIRSGAHLLTPESDNG